MTRSPPDETVGCVCSARVVVSRPALLNNEDWLNRGSAARLSPNLGALWTHGFIHPRPGERGSPPVSRMTTTPVACASENTDVYLPSAVALPVILTSEAKERPLLSSNRQRCSYPDKLCFHSSYEYFAYTKKEREGKGRIIIRIDIYKFFLFSLIIYIY